MASYPQLSRDPTNIIFNNANYPSQSDAQTKITGDITINSLRLLSSATPLTINSGQSVISSVSVSSMTATNSVTLNSAPLIINSTSSGGDSARCYYGTGTPLYFRYDQTSRVDSKREFCFTNNTDLHKTLIIETMLNKSVGIGGDATATDKLTVYGSLNTAGLTSTGAITLSSANPIISFLGNASNNAQIQFDYRKCLFQYTKSALGFGIGDLYLYMDGTQDNSTAGGMPASSRLHFPSASRRVGICMNNPAYTLDVGGIINSSSGGLRTTTMLIAPLSGNYTEFLHNSVFSSGAFRSLLGGSNARMVMFGGTNAGAGYHFQVGSSATNAVADSVTNFSTALCITSIGRIGIGTTTPDSLLQCTGIVNFSGTEFYCGGTSYMGTVRVGSGLIMTNGVNITSNNIYPTLDNAWDIGGSGLRYRNMFSANGVITTSDSKLKDFMPLSYGLNELIQIETIKYKWKNLKDDDLTKDFQYYGFKADQLKSIFPELVYDEVPDTPLQMNPTEIIPICVNAIKELNNTVNELRNEIKLLKQSMKERTVITENLEYEIGNIENEIYEMKYETNTPMSEERSV
jgi:hypothetical protein